MGAGMQAAVDNLTFEEWWAELAEAVRAWLLRRRCPVHLVDDIVQETGLRLFKMWDEIDAMRSPRGLAFTIASNLLWDERNRRSAREVVGDVPEQSREDVERAGIARLELARVRRAMGRLNPQQRAVLLAEIGDATGPDGSPDAVKMMRMRARKRLHALLETAPAGLFAFLKMPRRWWRTFRSAQRGVSLQIPAVALVATCTTIAIVGVPPTTRMERSFTGIPGAQAATARTAASAALSGVTTDGPGGTTTEKLSGSASTRGVAATPREEVVVEVPEGTPVNGKTKVSVTSEKSFVIEPPTCSAEPNGTTVHVRCSTQVGDKRVETDTVLGIDP
jgi:DNA-directed RNA polymerase specialized sigma24 family protein